MVVIVIATLYNGLVVPLCEQHKYMPYGISVAHTVVCHGSVKVSTIMVILKCETLIIIMMMMMMMIMNEDITYMQRSTCLYCVHAIYQDKINS